MPDFKWKPFEPLSDPDRRIDLSALRPLYENWQTSKERPRQSSPASPAQFNQRLIRRLSIETGILERLYDLDIGTTEALMIHGFVEELVSRSSTDIEPSRLIVIINDHPNVNIHEYCPPLHVEKEIENLIGWLDQGK